ncbi:MAG: hypothetical protein GX995_00450, partial [Clostridiales bacterium]|nr:hypothetical protein [Clostridiales bacterium]
SGKVHIEGGNEDIFNGMFYAPNSDITVKNHAEFNGPIVAYNITFNNKSDVNYETNNDDYQVPTTPQKTSDITVLIPDDDISPVREK